MEPVVLDHVCVIADSLAARDGPLSQAQDWASWLGLPLEILNPADAGLDHRNRDLGQLRGFGSEERRDDIPLKPVSGSDSDLLAKQLFRPHGLSVIGNALPKALKDRLVQASANAQENAILVCSPSRGPVSRTLILHDAHVEESSSLASALALCRVLRATPVILTTARTEAAARQGQRIAEEACLHYRTPAHLDYVVGMDLRSAVESIARWRHCSHVFLARRRVISWWSRPGPDILELLLGLADSIHLLALPERGVRLPTVRPPDRERAEFLAVI